MRISLPKAAFSLLLILFAQPSFANGTIPAKTGFSDELAFAKTIIQTAIKKTEDDQYRIYYKALLRTLGSVKVLVPKKPDDDFQVCEEEGTLVSAGIADTEPDAPTSPIPDTKNIYTCKLLRKYGRDAIAQILIHEAWHTTIIRRDRKLKRETEMAGFAACQAERIRYYSVLDSGIGKPINSGYGCYMTGHDVLDLY